MSRIYRNHKNAIENRFGFINKSARCLDREIEKKIKIKVKILDALRGVTVENKLSH